jgi:acyl-CoA hydrolase
VTVRNRVPHLDRFDAVVSAEPASGDGQTVAERVDDVDDEATVFLSPVSCGDTVRITVRSPDVGMELTRRVPCEP